MITKQYTYLFYLTVRITNWGTNNLIIRPLIAIFKLFQISEERILRIKKLHIRPIDSYDNGTDVNFAFSIMMWSLTCFILTVELLIFKALKHLELENSFIIIFYVAVLLSIVINYLILWKSDKYKAYFRKFKKEQLANGRFNFAIVYHLTMMIICFLLSINT